MSNVLRTRPDDFLPELLPPLGTWYGRSLKFLAKGELTYLRAEVKDMEFFAQLIRLGICYN